MGSFRGNCEIVEVNDEPSTTRRTFYPDQRPPMVKKGPNKFLEDDINKLFESVNLRSSKSLDLSDSWRNASKRPMRGSGSQSPGIGFSAPVSLKQSLRGLCISQAAEMAAMKRASLPASPRISEVGKFSNFYRSVVGEASGSGGSPSRGVEYKTKSCLMESTSCSSEISPPHHENTVMTSATQFSRSSPCLNVEPIIKNIECTLPVLEVDTALVETISLQKQESISDSAKPRKNASSKISGSNKVANDQSEESSANLKVINQTAPKQRRKPAPSSIVKNSNKDVKSTRSTTRSVKPVIRNKNLVIKKPKKVVVSTGGNLEASHEVNNGPSPGLAHSHAQLICQRCHCSLKETSNVSPNDLQAITSADVSKSDPISSTPHVVKTNMPSKSNEKGDISQSSKSSDFSSSTTSLSEESNLSGSNFGNRPHMSKDIRWMMIGRIRKQFGFLGLSHFNLVKKLGSGDIGTVYLAELVGTNCPFAIKVMDNEFLAQRQKMARAQTEREILRMLDHPFLPTLYAQFTSDNLSCLVMEFCPGGDLHVLRQKQPCRYFPEQAARFYVAEVLLALEYLHMLGIVYRDLKPENILVREDGHIMLTDFDLSLRCSVNPMLVKSSSLQMDPPRMSGPCAGSNCIDPFCAGPSCQVSCFTPRLLPGTSRSRKAKVDAATRARSLPQLVAEPTEARSNSFVGTHEYLAPEIIKGEGHGSAVDWWTFGVFLYELLYGKTPFKGVGNEETLDNVVLQNLRFPDSPMVSFQTRDLIRGLLVKEPEGRLGTQTGAAEIKRHPFFEGLNWALIRCAVPPEIPEMYDAGNSEVDSQEKGGKFMEYDGNGRHLEFELF